jgi:hypothetical protein
MKRSIARKWAKMLDSGDLKQSKYTLRNKNGFCCLGALCNLHATEHPEIAVKQKRKYVYLERAAILPTSVMEWSGMKTDNGGFNIYGMHSSLADLNDMEEWTFPQIAKFIRKNWKAL